jgi:hypothetical protein
MIKKQITKQPPTNPATLLVKLDITGKEDMET